MLTTRRSRARQAHGIRFIWYRIESRIVCAETTINKLNNVALAGADYALRVATVLVIVDWF
jgi:hypothetical protein